MRKNKETVPAKVKICTVISGALLFLVLALSVYRQMPSCAIKSIDSPLWGVLCLIVLCAAGFILIWGYRTSK